MTISQIKPTKAGIKKATETLLAEATTASECPMVRYAHLKALIKAAEDAAEAIKSEALNEALRLHPKEVSKRFDHKGLDFEIKRKLGYDFTSVSRWQAKNERYQKAQAEAKLLKAELNTIEERYLQEHPAFAGDPKTIEVTLAFVAKEK